MSDSLDFNSLFGNAELNYQCPNCKSDISFKLSDASSAIKCPKCNFEIQCDDYDKTVNAVDKLSSDFEDTLKKLGK